MNSGIKPESISKGIIPAYLSLVIYGWPFWLVMKVFGVKDKAIVQQESWLILCLIFGVCFLSFVIYRVYRLAATMTYEAGVASWFKLAIAAPWHNPNLGKRF